MKGSYILVLRVDRPLPGLAVGRLGRFDFAAGYYFYVGSAHGPGGLEARLAHHGRRNKARPHWHIDYLRAEARLCEAWTVAGGRPIECAICKAMAAHPALSAPAPGFGSRDTGCPTHLFYVARPPHPSLLTGIILGAGAEQRGELRLEIHTFDE